MAMRSYAGVGCQVPGVGFFGPLSPDARHPSPYDEYDISLTSMNASNRGVQTRFSARP